MVIFFECIKIFELCYFNCSIGIINGQISGIFNWNDILYLLFYWVYKELLINFWIFDEVDMKLDVCQYGELLGCEKNVYDLIIGLLVMLDLLQMCFIYNVVEYIIDLVVYVNVVIIGQQEVIYNESYSYVLVLIIDLLNQNCIFEIVCIYLIIIKCNVLIMSVYDDFMCEKIVEILFKLLIQFLILEGINFYFGFVYFYNMVWQNCMNGIGKIISFINCDELVYIKFISELICVIIGENFELQINELIVYVYQLFEYVIEFEMQWLLEVLDGIDGIDVDEMMCYVKYWVNKMVGMFGIECLYSDIIDNVMLWIWVYVDNFIEIKIDFFEMCNVSYKKINVDNGFDDF